MTAPSHQSRRKLTRPPSAVSRARQKLAGAGRFVGRVLRGMIAAAALLALLAGLPWALWHYVGWPLPDHVPTWAEVQGVLFGPMTTTFLLGFLACLCWIAWAAFTIDVLRCTARVVRGGFDAAHLPRFSATGPVHTLAAVLVGAVLLSVLGNRPNPAPTPSLSTALGTGTQVVATAPTSQDSRHGTKATVRGAVLATQIPDDGSTTARAPAHPESVVVLAPRNGVHDSLWRIAARTIGDGARWPEIFELNRGKPQPNGHPFTKPSLIFPGEELALPADTTAPKPSNPVPKPPGSTTKPPPTNVGPADQDRPPPSTHQAPPPTTSDDAKEPATRDPGVSWGPELFVGFGVAAAASAALLLARRRYRARYRPGSGDRDDLPVAPVVYELRLAHLRAEQNDKIDPDDDTDNGETEQQRTPAPPPRVIGEPVSCSSEQPALAPGLGVRDGREIALDLATARGLGLVGAGAPAATRALLVAALTASVSHPAGTSRASVFVTANDLAGVLGRGGAHAQLPTTLRVVANLDDALDALEAETLVRAAASRAQNTAPGTWPPLVLVARPAEHQRLQAVLDNGAPFGITGLLLGQWQPGITAYVREDGTISATSPGVGEPLRETRMFRLGHNDTAELLTLLHQAEPDRPADDEAVLQPAPLRRTVPTGPTAIHPAQAAAEQHTTDQDKGNAEPTSDTELEVPAAAQALTPADTELEIVEPSRAPAPGARPPAAALQQPGAPRASKDSKDDDASVPIEEPAVEPISTHTDGGEVDIAPAPITINVLGPLRVHWNPEPSVTGARKQREITGTLQPRTKELLVLLALHPDGVTRDALVSALWGQAPPTRPTNALHTALSRMRQALAAATDGAVADIASGENGRYQLDPATVRVDYWRFAQAVTARRAASTDQARINAYRNVVNSYAGPLAEGMECEWIEPAREATRRDAIDAVAALARALIEQDPQQTLDLLEVARAFDPHNELLYRDIMRLQERLGQLDAIPRTLTLLTTRLAEVDAAPTPQARGLAARLGHRHDDNLATPTESATEGSRGRSAAS